MALTTSTKRDLASPRAPRRAGYWLLLAPALVACSTSKVSGVVINELYANGPGDDWLELHNASPTQVDLGGFRLYDNPDERYPLPANTTLPPHGYRVIRFARIDGAPGQGFQLSAQGETVHLEDFLGRTIDRVQFPALDPGKTFGRSTEGEPRLVVLPHPTPGAANDAPATAMD